MLGLLYLRVFPGGRDIGDGDRRAKPVKFGGIITILGGIYGAWQGVDYILSIRDDWRDVHARLAKAEKSIECQWRINYKLPCL